MAALLKNNPSRNRAWFGPSQTPKANTGVDQSKRQTIVTRMARIHDGLACRGDSVESPKTGVSPPSGAACPSLARNVAGQSFPPANPMSAAEKMISGNEALKK